MKIAVFCPENLPHSSQIYTENITKELTKIGHTVIPFSQKELPEPADIYWEPSTGRNGPSIILKKAKAPVVVTFHGAANLVLPLSQCFRPGLKNKWAGYRSKFTTYYSWRFNSRFCDAVITVSEYAKKEAQRYLGLSGHLVTPVYHGVDHELFHSTDNDIETEPYFLHVSSYQPKKNLERIIAAYLQIPGQPKPRLIIVAPGYFLPSNYEGIELIRQPLSHQQIAELYQNALGFIFPSIHETFGMPIIEAMACGCPVITSNHPGCAETAGDAALIVNPYSVAELTHAMKQLIADSGLYKALRNKGIEHAKQFTWQKSAEKHLIVFKKVIEKKYPANYN